MVNTFILLSTLFRSLSLFLRQFTRSLKNIYDILCFAPLWIEQLIEQRPQFKTQIDEIENNELADSELISADSSLHIKKEA
jgi:hypothetical protein